MRIIAWRTIWTKWTHRGCQDGLARSAREACRIKGLKAMPKSLPDASNKHLLRQMVQSKMTQIKSSCRAVCSNTARGEASCDVVEVEMDERKIGFEHVPEDVLKLTAPMQDAWRKFYFDLPLAALSEGLRFAGQRLQAQGEFIASLRTCRTMPEVMEAQSQFVRAAVDQYGTETGKIMEDMRSTVSKAA